MVVAITEPCAFVARRDDGTFVMARFVVVARVTFAFVAKRLVEVAFVDVLLIVERFVIDDEAFAMRPPLRARRVVVAFPGKR